MSKSYIDKSKLIADLQKLAVLNNHTAEQELKDQGRFLVTDLQKIVPPTGKHALTEGFPAQLAAGKKAVNRDIGKNWRSASAILTDLERDHPSTAKTLKNYIRAGNVQAFKKVITQMGFPHPDFVVQNVSEADHDASRSAKTGRAIGRITTLVLGANSIKQLIRTKTSHIGRAKAGLNAAATALGVKGLPAWIKGKSESEGSYEPKLEGDNKWLIIRNRVPYIGNLVPQRLINNALRIRARAIEARIQYKLGLKK